MPFPLPNRKTQFRNGRHSPPQLCLSPGSSGPENSPKFSDPLPTNEFPKPSSQLSSLNPPPSLNTNGSTSSPMNSANSLHSTVNLQRSNVSNNNANNSSPSTAAWEHKSSSNNNSNRSYSNNSHPSNPSNSNNNNKNPENFNNNNLYPSQPSAETIRKQNHMMSQSISQYFEEIESLKSLNKQHEAEIESLLKFNERLLSIIEDEVNNNSSSAHKPERSLQPISEVTEVDSDVMEQMMHSLKKTKSRIGGRGRRGGGGGRSEKGGKEYSSFIQQAVSEVGSNNGGVHGGEHQNLIEYSDLGKSDIAHHYHPPPSDRSFNTATGANQRSPSKHNHVYHPEPDPYGGGHTPNPYLGNRNPSQNNDYDYEMEEFENKSSFSKKRKGYSRGKTIGITPVNVNVVTNKRTTTGAQAGNTNGGNTTRPRLVSKKSFESDEAGEYFLDRVNTTNLSREIKMFQELNEDTSEMLTTLTAEDVMDDGVGGHKHHNAMNNNNPERNNYFNNEYTDYDNDNDYGNTSDISDIESRVDNKKYSRNNHPVKSCKGDLTDRVNNATEQQRQKQREIERQRQQKELENAIYYEHLSVSQTPSSNKAASTTPKHNTATGNNMKSYHSPSTSQQQHQSPKHNQNPTPIPIPTSNKKHSPSEEISENITNDIENFKRLTQANHEFLNNKISNLKQRTEKISSNINNPLKKFEQIKSKVPMSKSTANLVKKALTTRKLSDGMVQK